MTLQQTEAGKTQVESGKAAIDAAVAQLRRQLNAMIGEELTAPLTLNALPEVTAEQLARHGCGEGPGKSEGSEL